jgi:large subunit ribosomal protein L5
MKRDSYLIETLYSKYKVANAKFQRFRELPIDRWPLPRSNDNQPKMQNTNLPVPVSEKSSNKSLIISQVEKFYHQVVTRDLILQKRVRGGMELPLATKVVINTTSKRFAANRKELTLGLAALLLISGQRGQLTTARKSIAAFKLREGTPLGCKVTLRGKKGYSMLDKLVTFVLPRGYPSRVRGTVDEEGNWGVGVVDPLLFVELEGQYDLFRSLEGINMSIVTTNRDCRTVKVLLFGGLQLVV